MYTSLGHRLTVQGSKGNGTYTKPLRTRSFLVYLIYFVLLIVSKNLISSVKGSSALKGFKPLFNSGSEAGQHDQLSLIHI